MTPKPLQDIIEGKVREFEKKWYSHVVHNKKILKHQQDWLRTALKEAIIEGIESVVGPEDISTVNGMATARREGWNACRLQILRGIDTIRGNDLEDKNRTM